MVCYQFTVSENWHEKTVRHFLKGEKQVSSTLLKTLRYTENGLLKNNLPVRTVDKLQKGDILTLNLPSENHNLKPSAKKAPILYEDKETIIYCKPAGMATHPSYIHREDTLANVFARDMEQRGEKVLFRPINRLDRNTSGLVLVAKNMYSAYWLGRTVRKTYKAVVTGHLKEKQGTIDLPIARKEDSIVERQVDPRGQRAVTHYKVVEELKGYSVAEVKLETGRTHQIRVHFSHIGHPLLGDDLYGGDHKLLKRQALTCIEISFMNIIQDQMYKICCDFEQDIQKTLENIGGM